MSAPALPVVVIIGRPNVGKSTLFNALVGSRRAIVGDEPGITRDRLYGQVDWNGKRFRLADTGGILPDERERIPREILKQAAVALSEATAVLMVVDAAAGVHPMDAVIHRLVMESGRPFYLVANKVDDPRHEPYTLPFYEFGVDYVYPVSAEHKRGLDTLLETVCADFPVPDAPDVPLPETRVAIIGRPNVGKSSLVNALVGSERVIVSEIPGTTRDAVDTELETDGCRYRLIDTAGIRKKSRTHLHAEKLSVILARKHLEQADLAVLLLDPIEGVTHTDATIASYAVEAGQALILGVNKLDLIPDPDRFRKAFQAEAKRQLRFLDYAPLVFFSAKTGRNVHRLFPVMRRAAETRRLRITTGTLNAFFRKMLRERQIQALPAEDHGVKYMTQVAVAPPTFVVFLRRGQRLAVSEERFIINQIRREFEFYANPIRLIQRS
ncbi:MAG TPA: ribosome biogenesis GTPase Der [Acidobacteriota bacterium]|nr:ribosome biogenesis GTPase Der [Acidobacteriota bacterium]HQF87571.1 ribosome biogenesis GTPase Der [Acidobacteriota bacterium]HQG92576.1 ribosome biogenesis GTPase Der [Acidobacteriota bacterium]